MVYQYDTHWTDNYSTRASYGYGSNVEGITIHWWGRLGQDHDNVVHFLAEVSDDSSAHEVISDGRVTHLIDFDMASWHSGSNQGNGTMIGLECRPEMTDGDLETLAQRCADIETQLGKSLHYNGHSYWTATECPGTYLDKLDWLINRINEIKNGIENGDDEMNNEQDQMLTDVHWWLKAIAGNDNEIMRYLPPYDKDTGNARGLWTLFQSLWNEAFRNGATLDALMDAVSALSNDPDITVDTMREIVNNAVEQHITLTPAGEITFNAE